MFQQRQGESLSEAWTRFKDLLQKVLHHGIDLWLQVQIFYDRVNLATRRTIDQSAGAHLAPKQPIQVNKITSSCKICSGPHDIQYCMENLEQAFFEYASLRTDEAGEPEQTLEDKFKDLHLNFPVLEVLAHAPMYNAILDKYVENLELGDSKPFDTLADLGSCVNIILLYLFKKLNIGLLEETDHVFELADGTKSYPVGIVRDVEVHVGRLKLLNDFYLIDIKKDPETSLLVGRGFLATANAVIDCRKAKIAA
uniref:DNA damage-inducible protein 1-like n=1 Tax=Tanacetum cinerariifolium TaxID=118510 RepID=A0A699HF16_TANCI|nr:DNA damage-inducible protein 1-like [Tanacetum cinerariifolium]